MADPFQRQQNGLLGDPPETFPAGSWEEMPGVAALQQQVSEGDDPVASQLTLFSAEVFQQTGEAKKSMCHKRTRTLWELRGGLRVSKDVCVGLRLWECALSGMMKIAVFTRWFLEKSVLVI